MSEEEFEREVQELLIHVKAAFKDGKGYHFPIGTRSHVWIIPSFVVEPEHRKGFLICLEGRGSLFIDRPEWGGAFTLVKAGIPLATGEILARVLTRLMQPNTGPQGPSIGGGPRRNVKRIGKHG